MTIIDVGSSYIVQVKRNDKEQYQAVQIGIGERKNFTKALLGHAKKAKLTSVPLKLREIRIGEEMADDAFVQGAKIKIEELFKPGDIVNVIGVSKGKGYAGVVKRHHFKGGPRTHGQSDRERAPGSIGQTTTPGRVYKGKRMAGRMGHERVTIAALEVVDVDAGGNIVLVKGLVPGPRNSIVTIEKTGVKKKFTPLYKTASRGEKTEEPLVLAHPEANRAEVAVETTEKKE